MKAGRFAYLATSTLFLFFLIYSTPHRVHHLFDEHKAQSGSTAEQSPEGPNHTPKSPDTSCAFHLASKSCHISLTSTVHIASVPLFIKDLASILNTRIVSSFLPNAFQIRAPPKA
jgi:hypothetical protein